ncbi:response regulator transcription factor [Tanticharoenia sakaeratensis]|uniref:Two-component response regulator n=1 Tax=Tanticharoenia sakaeratensis NBRC 103193 TaxID=1231623 RepID=A0A0D6MLA6_9PROT|nr:response regulator [Tanticharoenia sakaeratensis]GAN54068.1 two-component response regulator [Tanticharoenia sakaeratensis NBRC 103193]GBQ23746.1 response regulator [Tanticharoenia sakaeratensis NBRC 103193]
MTARVHILDDDADVRDALDSLLRAEAFEVMLHDTHEAFLDAYDEARNCCLLLDVRLGDVDGLDVQAALPGRGIDVPVIVMTGHGDVPMAVRGMKAGAIDFLSKPFPDDALLGAIDRALARDCARLAASAERTALQGRYALLTPREREVAGLVVAGLMNKQIAGRLGLELVTVKIHRGQAMRKMEAQSLADLVRMLERLGVRATGISRYGAD